jgi:hypothetical protein
MAIDWKGMSHDMLTVELRAGLAVKQQRIDDLEAIGTPKLGRPKGSGKNGSEFPEAPRGSLDEASS